MAKIIVTIEDMKDGSVRAVTNPSMTDMAKQLWVFDGKGAPVMKRREPTPAEAYSLKAMHAIREASKRLDKLDAPRIAGPGDFFK